MQSRRSLRTYLFKTPSILKKLYPGLTWDKRTGSEKQIYLTFDDGPIPEVTPWVLDQLAAADVLATFFMVGENIKKHPDIFNSVIDAGHSFGNHTYNHLDGWKTATDTYLDNINKCQKIIEEQGQNTNLFRPPYGKIRREQIPHVAKSHEIIMWDYLTGDFDHSLGANKIIRNFKRKVKSGAIVVFHDNIKSFEVVKKALPVFLSHFKEQDYQFMTL